MTNRNMKWYNRPNVRSFLYTLAVSLSFNSLWRTPREGFKYGGLVYSLALTLTTIIVAQPVALLQLALGQLIQDDTVRVWHAVPFFRGVGYLKVLISFIASLYTSVYIGLTLAYFFFTCYYSIPFWECPYILNVVSPPSDPEIMEISFNVNECESLTYLPLSNEKLRYFMVISVIIITFVRMPFPFMFKSAVKYMKKFFILGPIVILVAGITLMSCLGNKDNTASFVTDPNWSNFLDVNMWHSAIIQSLWTMQVAGGYLILAGGSMYSKSELQMTTKMITVINVLASWAGSLFWFSISPSEGKASGVVMVLEQIYDIAYSDHLHSFWPLCLLALILLSGVITMFVVSYPVYVLIRRSRLRRWRMWYFMVSLVATGMSIAVLFGIPLILYLLEDIAVPLLIIIATVLEMLSLVYIYGGTTFARDIEILTDHKLAKHWVWGWYAVPWIIIPFAVWWLTILFTKQTDSTEDPWETITALITIAVAFLVFFSIACVSVTKQIQYDLSEKLKASFKPSRKWGPRDHIVHFFWLFRRNGLNKDTLEIRFEALDKIHNKNRLNKSFSATSALNASTSYISDNFKFGLYERSTSDGLLCTVYPRRRLAMEQRKDRIKERSKSLSWHEPKVLTEFRQYGSIENNTVELYF